MHYELKTLDLFHIIGIAVRTTNENGQSQKDIGVLWQTFFTNNILEQIPNKVNNDIYCVYTDYESDAAGAYTTILGCKVATMETVPDGCISKTIPGATYRVYQSVGKLPDSVIATWMHIWQTEINRNYVADFDVYGSQSQDPMNAVVETYVSVHVL